MPEQGHDEARIGIAISGGGHRATVWGLGALLAVADAGLNDRVVSIASVSGGSIANGVIAHDVDYAGPGCTAGEVEDAMRDCLKVMAHEGLFAFGPPTNAYLVQMVLLAGVAVAALLAALAAAVSAGRGWPWWPFLLLSLVAVVVAVKTRARPPVSGPRAPRPRPPLPGWFRAAAIVAALIVGPAVAGAVALVRHRHGAGAVWLIVLLVVVAVALLAVALRHFGQRSAVVDGALAARLYHDDHGRATTLASLAGRQAHHVFCATELQAGDHCYLTPRLVYSYLAGCGTPGTVPLSTAVQASACLPGAFGPRTIDVARAGLGLRLDWKVDDTDGLAAASRLVLNDGGVYDNMADQWEQGYDPRAKRLHLDPDGGATELIVVNAGKAMGWKTMRPGRSLVGEAGALKRTVDILYDVSTAHRRQGLVRRFGTSDLLGGGLHGALVHIARSPFYTPQQFGSSPDPDRRARAAEALGFLSALGADEAAWEQRALASPDVATTLGALGAATTVDLFEHAYYLTRINVYVILGRGELAGHEAEFRRARFEALVG